MSSDDDTSGTEPGRPENTDAARAALADALATDDIDVTHTAAGPGRGRTSIDARTITPRRA